MMERDATNPFQDRSEIRAHLDAAVPPRTIVAVKFKWGDKTYDYFADIPVEVGQRVYVPTSKGETKAEVVEIKTNSDRVEKSILRLVEEEVR